MPNPLYHGAVMTYGIYSVIKTRRSITHNLLPTDPLHVFFAPEKRRKFRIPFFTK